MKLRASPFMVQKIPLREILMALFLGLIGFCLNMLELQLGWGVHFIFGNALVYVFIRVLAPTTLVLAISVSSLWTIFLWDHPWAWIVWVCEAIFIAAFAGKSSPVRSDVLFWLVLGAPLILLTYGGVMMMEQQTLLLVILKQSANGILNIVLGELIYVAIIGINPLHKFRHWPKLKVESVVITLLMAVILIPTAVYLALDAPSREQSTRQGVSRHLEYVLQVRHAAINNWVQSRTLMLQIYAEGQLNKDGEPDQRLLDKLSPEFEHITITAHGRSVRWSMKQDGEEMPIGGYSPDQSNIITRMGVRLVTTAPTLSGQGQQFAIIIPFKSSGEAGIITAQLRDGHFNELVDVVRLSGEYDLFLVSPLQGVLPVTGAASALTSRVRSLSQAERLSSVRAPLLLSDVGYNSAIMSDLRNAQILRSVIIEGLPEWQLIAAAPLAPAVSGARKVQLQQFLALMAFISLITLVASVLSRRISQTLRMLSQSAADLAATGEQKDHMDGVVMKEVHDIYGTIASAGTVFGRERGVLASHQRRLNSIAQHAPVIVYALDVANGAKGGLVYVSDSLETILGYAPADAMEPEWWSHAVHPDDYDSCMEQFTSLEPGKVVCIEYRLLHKAGHYVWVYDTVSVEANPQSEALEAVGVIMDISERKAAAEQLLQADKMASLGRMISGTAHELNQPLNFIKMAASNLRENTVRGQMDAGRFLPKLEHVLSQVERASAILLQMRIFGRTPKESPYPINVRSAVDAVVTMVAPQFELDGTHVVVVENGDQVYIRALPVLLEQVLLNLLLNANDAIKTRYGAGNATEGIINVTIERRSPLVAIIVEDNGTGIPSDVLRKIFDPFYTTKPPKEGTGLGLSISYGIVRDLGGMIRAKSGRNGARFTIELPLAPRSD